MSDLTRLYYLLLVANASYLALTKSDNQVENYCHLCTRHTMCRYPFDDVSPNCKNIEHGDLDPEEIISIVNQHNLRRNFIASGKEIRGNPGPQPPAKNMMELSWDDELAVLARRWALQCVLSKDECRDVTRFQVWQNINILNIDTLEINTNSLNRIKLHIKTWSDDVQNFDSAEVGLVDFAEDNRGPYIGIAAGNITLVGCGRAIYSQGLRERGPSTMTSTSSSLSFSGSSAMASANPQAGTLKLKLARPRGNKSISSLVGDFNSVRGHRLEVLVCNYGGIDRTTPQNLYEDGMPGYCPEGLTNSPRYKYLCRELLLYNAFC
ncbi:hypothetical protein KQX54_006194 [Cotesia glomerata]|uniref:SCP domain-containing protein n=1 Tax=Cotesia glomerata TaxID=32391 RepID=A0AAV7I1B8_COTGL|nr:hypothetical protein KQX54_006194 [Cotesia glomerata]